MSARLPEEMRLTGYTVAKIATDPRSLEAVPRELRAKVEEGMRDAWSIAKVSAMKTEAIEDRLRSFGVDYTRDAFLRMASATTSAWSLSEIWIETGALTCDGKDEDFLGLAACELWKRLCGERPSIEMLDDWMQEGYERVASRREKEACDTWWKTWAVLASRFTPEMRTLSGTTSVFLGMQSLFNWCQDFETHLGNAALKDPAYAEIGRAYAEAWLAQFPDEDVHLPVNMSRALALFLFVLGRAAEAERVLLEIVRRYPRNVWGYVALADAHSHRFHRGSTLPRDPARAKEWLERGLKAVGADAEARKVLMERLKALASPSA